MAIQSIYCTPPICVARVGGSTVPLDAFSWVASVDPHVIGETAVKPEWTLDVQSDQSVLPRLPDRLVLKDNNELRPVAPFIEVWCEVGDDGDEANWVRQPLTPQVLADHGLNLANLTFQMTAMNFKVARRTGNPDHRYGTLAPVTLRGDEHSPTSLEGVSPAVSGVPLIPVGRSIPLGRIQVIRPGIQPAATSGLAWIDDVNIAAIRLRVTPPAGRFYGPPGSATNPPPLNASRGFTAVQSGGDFLNANAGWFGAATVGGLVSPGDTYDGAERGDQRSLGICDDTSEIQVRVRLDQTPSGGNPLACHANVFVGPPDYAPDRRPFVSLADSFNDRAANKKQRNQALSDEELDRWIEDLFERAYETVSLFNVDIWRRVRGATLESGQMRPNQIPEDDTRDPTRAMGGRDALRDGDIAIDGPSDNVPLPLSERARERHRNLSDIVALKRFIREHPQRLEELIRSPFSVASNENGNATTMQMPPFMRNSNAQPLTLTVWQYELLMEWQARVLAGPVTIEEERLIPSRMSDDAALRRTRVLEQIRSGEDLP